MYTSKELYQEVSSSLKDPILEWKNCAMSWQPFAIYQSDVSFLEKLSPVIGGVKQAIPLPMLCPEERRRRRLLFRNERSLFKRKCDASGETMISIYHPNCPFPVYKPSIWRWDSWDAMDYGFDFDFSKTFSEQWLKLKNSVPMPRRTAHEPSMTNSDYCNEAGGLKDCYLTFEGGQSEWCLYSRGVFQSNFCMDCLNCDYCEQSYQCVESQYCHSCQYMLHSDHCNFSAYCTDCVNCNHCFGCSNLRNKEYYFFNKPCGNKENYEKKVADFCLAYGRGVDVWDQINERLSIMTKHMQTIRTENCLGNYLVNSSNCVFCYSCGQSQDCRYCDSLLPGELNADCMDVTNFGIGSQLSYECECVWGNPWVTTNALFSWLCWHGSHFMYSFFCVLNCHHLFGCVWLKGKEYCVFNKQYTKNEYEKLVTRIIAHMRQTGEWWEFLHPSLTSFSYNDTVAQEHMPLRREEVMLRGYQWNDENRDPVIPEWANVVDRRRAPFRSITWLQVRNNMIAEADLLKSIFICEKSWRPFRLVPRELEFYRRHSLPLPKQHSDLRHESRMGRKPARRLSMNQCATSGDKIISAYPEDWKQHVVSEEIYRRDVLE